MICNYKFSKVNAIRKGKSGACNQEKSCLKFSQAEENFKPILVTVNNINIIILSGKRKFIAVSISKKISSCRFQGIIITHKKGYIYFYVRIACE